MINDFFVNVCQRVRWRVLNRDAFILVLSQYRGEIFYSFPIVSGNPTHSQRFFSSRCSIIKVGKDMGMQVNHGSSTSEFLFTAKKGIAMVGVKISTRVFSIRR
jgi:hypothetical protein